MIPFKGDDNAELYAWQNACKACRHISKKYGCTRWGIVEYEGGGKHGMFLIHGGCNKWEPRA